MGLLSRASILDEEKLPGLAFSDFINKHSLKICALLEKNASNYVVSNSVDFDAASILTATSTIDFWKGICKEVGEIYYFAGLDKSPLLQLFSFNLKDNISDISVYQNSHSQILLCEGKLSQAAVQDFENISSCPRENNFLELNPLIKKNSVVLLLNLDFAKAIEAFLSSENLNPQLNDALKKAILNEFYNRFTCRYNLPDATVMVNDSGLKTVFVSGKAYSFELIKNHILLNLKEVLEDFAKETVIDFSGTADSCDKVKSFLQAE